MRHDAPGPFLLKLWSQLSRIPGGRLIFGVILGRMVPYSGALGARVETLRPGEVEIRLRERRAVRNHLRSIHAIALMNLGELATGLSVITALPPGVQGIVVELRAEYLRKARGTVRAVARFEPPPIADETRCEVTSTLTNEAGEEVAVVTATWSLRRRPMKEGS